MTNKPVQSTRPQKHPSRFISRWYTKRVFILVAFLFVMGGLLPLPFWMSKRSLRRGDPQAALAWLEWADWHGVAKGEVALQRNRAYRVSGDFAQVREQLLAAQRAGVSRTRLEHEQWLAMAQAGRMDVAEAHLAELLERQEIPVNEVCSAYASGFLLTARPGEALRLIDAWLKDEPAEPQAHYLRGQAHALGKQFLEAEADFRKVLVQAPWRSDAALALGEALLELQQPEAAQACFDRAAADKTFPDAFRARLGQARAARKSGNPSHARTLLEQLVQKDPKRAENWEELGRTRIDLGDIDGACTAFEKAVQLRPAMVSARQGFAEALMAKGDRKAAEVHLEFTVVALTDLERMRKLEDHVEKTPRDVASRWEIAQLYHKYDTHDLAIAWARSVLLLEPSHPGALSMIGNGTGTE